MPSIDIAEVARGLAGHVGELAPHLFPHGQRLGREWAVGSLAGEPGQSLRIALAGSKGDVPADVEIGGQALGSLSR